MKLKVRFKTLTLHNPINTFRAIFVILLCDKSSMAKLDRNLKELSSIMDIELFL